MTLKLRLDAVIDRCAVHTRHTGFSKPLNSVTFFLKYHENITLIISVNALKQ